MQVRKIRLLRRRFNISLRELSEAAGVSKQRMSEVELGEYSPRAPLAEKISEAFTTIVAEKAGGHYTPASEGHCHDINCNILTLTPVLARAQEPPTEEAVREKLRAGQFYLWGELGYQVFDSLQGTLARLQISSPMPFTPRRRKPRKQP